MTPARLGKEDNMYSYNHFSLQDKMEAWCINHATILFFILLCVLMALFIALIYALVGVSATESGTVYNQMKNVI